MHRNTSLVPPIHRGAGLLAAAVLVLLSASLALAAPGDFDRSFGTNGRVTTDVQGYDWATSVTLGPGGQIVTGGYVSIGDSPVGCISDYTFALTRHDSRGRPDPTFDRDGALVYNYGGGCEFLDGVVIDKQGRPVIVGTTFVYPNESYGSSSFVVTRLDSAEKRDRTFGTEKGGGTLIDFNDSSLNFAAGIGATADGKYVVAGSTGLSSDIAIARLTSDGKFDASFGKGGKVTARLPGSDSSDSHDISAMALYPDGRIVVAGAYSHNDTRFLLVARFLKSGKPDRTFGKGGFVTVKTGTTGYDPATAVAVDTQGRVVVAGDLDRATDQDDVLVYRFSKSGKPDGGFGKGGRALVSFGAHDRAEAVAVQSDGRVVVVGSTAKTADADSDWAVARLTAGGTLDRTFVKTGKKVIDFGGDDGAEAVAIDPATGGIVIAGEANTDFGLVRLQG